MWQYFIILVSSLVFVSCMSIVNPGPQYPPTRGEVWPKPQYEFKETSYYLLNPSLFKIEITKETCDILTRAVERYSYTVKNEHGHVFRDGKELHHRQAGADADDPYLGPLHKLQVELTAPCETYPYLEMDESYNLTISASPILTSASLWGVLRGLETFSQLFYLSNDRNEVHINTTQINDFPKYSHRGLLLDTSRHYISISNILKTLDAMAINKMNVFHWHIVDDQSFPYESVKFPELSMKGAYDASMIYTRENIQRIVEYARDRGIRVIPEFDVPGHTRSWGNAYPNILTECYRDNEVIGLGPMDPTNNVTYKLLRDLFQEVQTWFPDKYFHIGGDEVELDCWSSNPRLKEYMDDQNISVADLHALFMRNVIPLLANDSKGIVWQEVFDEGVPLPPDTLVQVWKSHSWTHEMIQILSSGNRLLFSSAWYLDHLDTEWTHMYQADPRQMVWDALRNESMLEGIVGGEACMWAEKVDDSNVISRVWPRASAVAERLWRAPGRAAPRDAAGRLEELACRLARRGVRAQPPSGPGFCLL